jgi:ribonuclease BN (tRNA processing enzyme)
VIPRLLAFAAALLLPALAHAQGCGDRGVHVQVLGSGGPSLQGGRAATSRLLWVEGRARALVDVGGGTALRFGESGAAIGDLDVVFFTHLRADHSAGFPALIHASLTDRRDRPLPVYGPPGNRYAPSTVTFVRDLFDPVRGVWRHLGDLVSPLARPPYRLDPHDVREKPQRMQVGRKGNDEPVVAYANTNLRALAVPTAHGQLPALAWRIEAGGRSIVLTGDSGTVTEGLRHLARGADLLIAHNAAPEARDETERALYLPPSAIGRLASEAGVKQLVLAHRTARTLGREDETTENIRRHYGGPLAFANDLDCFRP